MTLDHLLKLVEDRAVVRVWDGQHQTIRAQGCVVGLIEPPTLVVVDKYGFRHHESSGLPIDVMDWSPITYAGQVVREQWTELPDLALTRPVVLPQ